MPKETKKTKGRLDRRGIDKRDDRRDDRREDDRREERRDDRSSAPLNLKYAKVFIS